MQLGMILFQITGNAELHSGNNIIMYIYKYKVPVKNDTIILPIMWCFDLFPQF